MKYGILLRFLRILVYIKRAFWWLGPKMSFVLGKIFMPLATVVAFFRYKTQSFIKKIGVPQSWLLKRNFLQLVIFLIIGVAVLPESKVLANKNLAFSGQKTQAYQLLGVSDEIDIEEVSSDVYTGPQDVPSWKAGALDLQIVGENPGEGTFYNPDLGGAVAGGTAIMKPIIMPGSTLLADKRQEVTNYTIQPGDSLSEIAQAYSVSVATIMWENSLTLKSLIKPGDTLKIPPTSGIMHTVKKGDTIKKIATLYDAEPNRVISFNHLKEDGSDLQIGERIMVPGGEKPDKAIAVLTPKSPTKYVTTPVAAHIAAPPASAAAPSASGYVWPSGVHTITQYFGIKHHALDIAGPWQTPTYAAAAGTVEKSQCGWNSGYGCEIVIDHGNGIKTLYGHHSKLLVSAGDYVEAGQTIGLMGNTGHVTGVTGIHLHFEVIRNGARVNPLLYVK